MIDKRDLEELGERLSDAARRSPVQDLEKNLRTLLGAFFDRFDVVLREDFDVQSTLLERAQAKLAALEARVDELEKRR
jgi:ubiquinone biosynthesis accessory factor UbiK